MAAVLDVLKKYVGTGSRFGSPLGILKAVLEARNGSTEAQGGRTEAQGGPKWRPRVAQEAQVGPIRRPRSPKCRPQVEAKRRPRDRQ